MGEQSSPRRQGMSGRVIPPCLVVAALAATISCGGGVVSYAGIQVSLAEPVEYVELFHRVDRLAHELGFPQHGGDGVDRTQRKAGGESSVNVDFWYDTPVSEPGWEYRLRTIWLYYVPEVSEFRLLFYNDGTDSFTADEWRWFFDIAQAVSDEFPGASIRTHVHPAKWTHAEELARISRETGIPLPEEARERARDHEQWHAKPWIIRVWYDEPAY